MDDLTHENLERMLGAMVLEFGAEWCGYCQRAQPLIKAALSKHQSVRHIKIEDGKGKRLGRQFGIKLWPSLIFLKNGKEVSRLVRPHDEGMIVQHLTELERLSKTDSQ